MRCSIAHAHAALLSFPKLWVEQFTPAGTKGAVTIKFMFSDKTAWTWDLQFNEGRALREEGLFIHPVIVPRRIHANASHEVLDPIHITEDILSKWKDPKILSSIRRGLRDAKYVATTDAETAEKSTASRCRGYASPEYAACRKSQVSYAVVQPHAVVPKVPVIPVSPAVPSVPSVPGKVLDAGVENAETASSVGEMESRKTELGGISAACEKEVSVTTMVNFDEYSEFMAINYDATLVVTWHADELEAIKDIVASIRHTSAFHDKPCGGGLIAVGLMTTKLRDMMDSVLTGADVVVWGPRPKEEPLCEPHKTVQKSVLADPSEWLGEVEDSVVAVRELAEGMVEGGAEGRTQSEGLESVGSKSTTPVKMRAFDYGDIRRRQRQGEFTPRVLPPAADGKSRPIERRENITRDELLSYVLYGIPVIVTDAMRREGHEWGILNWTYVFILEEKTA